MKRQNTLFISFCLALSFVQGVHAQQNQQLENMLNKVDNSNWSNVPPSGMQPIQQPMLQQLQQPPQQPMQYNPQINSPYFNQMRQVGQPNIPVNGRQQFLRMLFGGSPQTNSTKENNNKWGSSTAYSDWQEAENQASKARDAEERARYDKDKGNRQSNASEAYYASEAARQASDRVYYASQNGDPTAKQYDDRARAAADRARADSDRARYYADTGN